MLILVIQVKDYKTTEQQIKLAYAQQADGVELRLDYLKILDVKRINHLTDSCQKLALPVILTLRKKTQGGFYAHSEKKRLQDILALCKLQPDYIDLEYDISQDFLKKIKLLYPGIKIIFSYHDFHQTPKHLKDLIAVFDSLQNPYTHIYKMATYANNTLDALNMLELIHMLHEKYFFTGICMGEEGQITRILSPVMGNVMTYASLDEAKTTAPGQLTLKTLLTVYHLKKLNTSSKIYALLGDPVDMSVGHILHNQVLTLLNKNAVYIKLRAAPDRLEKIIAQCRRLPFAGLSITMPLKESILPFLDDIDILSQPIKSINSVIFSGKKLTGFNTDGLGAMKVLSQRTDIAKQTIIILGAGGAARAIAYEALQQKAKIIIINRTLSKAKKLAAELGCQYHDLNYTQNYTAVINTLPNSVYDDKDIQKNIQKLLSRPALLSAPIIAMDIVYQPLETVFLGIARKAGCACISGDEMYIYQALMQIKRWFKPNTEQLNTIKKLMREYFLHLPARGYTE